MAEIYQAVALQRWLGQEVRNILYYEFSGTSPTTTTLQDMSDDVRGAWSTSIGSALTDEWALYGVIWRRVDEAGWPGVEYGFTSGVLTGTNTTGESQPTQVAMLVHGLAYTTKPNRVRSYLGGFTELALSDGLFTSTAITNGGLWASALDTLAFGGETMTRVAAQWNPDHSVVVATNPIGTYTVSQVPGTQRRRRIGRGA
jgi:hypothetical protein